MWANELRLFFLGDGKLASRAILWLIGFFAFLNVYAMQAVLPLVMQDFHASPVQAGLTVGATVLGVALVSPFMGMLSDALGRKLLVGSAMLVLSLPTALIAWASSLEMLIALRFLQGLLVPGIVVVIIAYIAEEFRAGNVARVTATYIGGTVMGGFCGRFITGHASDWLGWRHAFLLLALLNLLGALLVLKLLPPSRSFVPNRNIRAAMATLWRHLQHRRLRAACAIGFCVLFSLVGTFNYVNLHLAAAPFQLSAAGLANVFCVYLVGVLVTPMAGPYVARWGFLRSLLSALALSAAGLLLTLSPWLALVILGLTVCSSGIFICQSATLSAIAHTISEGRSLATGLYYLCYYAGGAAGSVVAGLAFEAWAWEGAVISIALIQALAAAIALSFWRQPAPSS